MFSIAALLFLLRRRIRPLLVLLAAALAAPVLAQTECDNWQTLHPDWIFCDDFEEATSLVRDGRYFDNVVVATTRIGCLPPTGWIFSGGFESGATNSWSTSVR